MTRTGSNDAYAFTPSADVTRGYVANGLNQYTLAGGVSPTHDARGNVTGAGGASWGYTSENRLATSSAGYAVSYDPLGRLHWISAGGALTWRQYDGADAIEERDDFGVLRRYVYGPGDAAPLLWYEGAGTIDKRYLHADERGSVIAVSDPAGNALAVNRYDAYGVPQAGNLGRFQYTGQPWVPELGLYLYWNRMMDIKLLKASSLLGVMDRRELINDARSSLTNPVNENVMAIALCDEHDIDCIDQALEMLFVNSNVENMSLTDALMCYARSISAKITDGSMSPLLGSNRISKVAIESAPDGYVELDPFIYASSEVESRPEDRAFFEDAILEEARRIMAQF